jgi:hypothetical protein
MLNHPNRSKKEKPEVTEARELLRKWLKPGDTVHTILDHVSRSGMCRHIRLVVLKCENDRPIDLHPNHAAGLVLGYRRAKRDGLVVGGCGMDMGFHIVHSLGYALWGKEASEGTGEAANALRKAIYEADKFYWHQGGKKEPPDWTKPGREWFGGAGYALKHKWL